MYTPDTEQLRRWMDNLTTPEETNSIEQWLREAGSGPVLRQMDNPWKTVDQKMDEAATARLWQRLHTGLPVHTAKIKPLWRKPLMAVAIVIAIVCAAGIIWQYTANQLEDKAVAWHTVSNKKQHKMYCRLPDGSEVWLSPQTVLRYRETTFREVILEGEAFFSVHSNAQYPFNVTAGQVHTNVLGTRFNIEAWPGEVNTYIALTEGLVQTSFPNNAGTADSLLIKPGTALLYNRNNRHGIAKNISTGTEADWMQNRVVLHDLSPQAALERVARFYGKQLSFKAHMQSNQLFNAVLPGNDLNAALQNIAFVYRLSYRVADDTIYISN